MVAGQQRRAQRKEFFERAKEEKAIAEVELGQDACLHAQNNMRNLLDRLQEHLRHYQPADHHAAECHFWQAVAVGPSPTAADAHLLDHSRYPSSWAVGARSACRRNQGLLKRERGWESADTRTRTLYTVHSTQCNTFCQKRRLHPRVVSRPTKPVACQFVNTLNL